MAVNKSNYGCGSWSTVVKRGNTYIRFRKTYGNERKEFVAKTKKEVLEKVKAYEENPLTNAQQKVLKMNFCDFVDACARKFAEIKRLPGPTDWQLCTISRLAKSKLGKIQLASVNEKRLTEFLMEQADKGYARRTINNDYGFIKRCLEHAVNKKILKENPAKNVAYLREDEVQKEERVVESLQIDDIEKLLKEAKRVNTVENTINGAIGEPVYGVNADVVVFLFYTGLRINEALALTWNDLTQNDKGDYFINVRHSLKEVRGANGKVTRQRGKTKTKCSVRMVSLTDDAYDILMKQKKRNKNIGDDDFIFQTAEGTSVAYRNVNRTLANMMTRSKCSKVLTAHSLRHSFGSYLISNGADLYAVSKLLGHSSIKVTEQVYAELLQDFNVSTTAIFNNLKIAE